MQIYLHVFFLYVDTWKVNIFLQIRSEEVSSNTRFSCFKNRHCNGTAQNEFQRIDWPRSIYWSLVTQYESWWIMRSWVRSLYWATQIWPSADKTRASELFTSIYSLQCQPVLVLVIQNVKCLRIHIEISFLLFWFVFPNYKAIARWRIMEDVRLAPSPSERGIRMQWKPPTQCLRSTGFAEGTPLLPYQKHQPIRTLWITHCLVTVK